MSASSKKKLRNAQEAEKMTEKQLKEQKEAKKLKLYTAAVVVLVVAIVIAAVAIVVSKTVANKGIVERKTIAATVNGHSINTPEFGYFYMDSINNFANQYGSYASLFGLDTTKPLDQQVYSKEDGQTWADYFMQAALENAKATYAAADAAKAEGFTLNEEEQASVESAVSSIQAYAVASGAGDVDTYMRAVFGNGASLDSYRSYYETVTLANAYRAAYVDGLSYTPEQIQAESKANSAQYSSYNYNTYYLSASRFLEGGTQDGDTVTYSDAEKAASVKAAEAAAAQLVEAATDVEAFDAAIAALDINKESTSASSSAFTGTAYSSVNSAIQSWVADSSRKAGDVTYIASSSTDADGNETVAGYYVVLFGSVNDNQTNLVNVRHILVSYETNATDEQKAAAKQNAENILALWQNGPATEETFASLAVENSTDSGSKDNGGLYENVYPGQMVASFNDWCFDASRKAGDTGVVETEYGVHVMYFVGTSDTTYREYQINNALKNQDYAAWASALLENVTAELGDTSRIRTDLVMKNNG